MHFFDKHKRWPLFFIIFFFVNGFCFYPVEAETTQDKEVLEENIDIDSLSREIHNLEDDYEYPDFSDLFESIRTFQFTEVAEELGEWLIHTLTYEITSSKILISELIGIIIFSAVFSNISSSFQQFSIGNSGFLISYFITFTLIFSNFTIMANLFKNTVVMLSRLLKMLIPAYTLTVTLSGNITTGVTFYEYFMIVVLVTNWLCINVILPLIQYYLLLELLNNFSTKQNISKLCENLYILLSKGMKLIFVLFFGFHLLETMIVPSFDSTKNTVLNKMVGLIPGAGSIVQTVTGTVLSSSILIKNTLGVSVIIFILLILAVPMIKLLLYTLIYLILSILMEPIADERFARCITAAQKSGLLLIYSLCITASLFILTIAITALVTNKI